ncbi:ligand-gated channel [Veronia nyctiphanis]|uniref:Ligand-gated channel n=1 Tax=Veronia nyctiphanis TaxID=1278244 RepID=A0A4Q0YQ05_9GAMM|nr:TonB-dependent receptor [Veronia nyctiphanis]RXJ72673.1 ligand-gated channel [Veronia nyctiphanis]
MSTKRLVAGMLPLVALIHAQTTLAADETVIVTASRFEQPINNIIAPVSIVTKDEIEAMQANSVVEVLKQLPGVQISSNGGYGQQATVYVRGSKNVLVLLNGVRIGSATLGNVNFGQLPLTGIERIEFIRGSRAAVYGADATAGVINIITEHRALTTTGTASVTRGSDKYSQLAASFASPAGESSWLKMAANYEKSDGFDVATFGKNDDDGFRNKDLLVELGSELNDNWQLITNAYYHRGDVEYDNQWGPGDESEDTLTSLSGKLEYRDNTAISTITLAQNSDTSKTKGKVEGSSITTKRSFVSWHSSHEISRGYFIGGGLEYVKEDVGDSELISGSAKQRYEVTSRDNKAGYITLSRQSKSTQLEASLRHDDNEQYGHKTTWQLGGGWKLTDFSRLTANVGTGFRVPTFNDLYWPGYSNPTLKPEKTIDTEIALEGVGLSANWRLAIFKNEITDRISCQGGGCSNDRVDITGIEFTNQFDTGNFYHDVTLEYIDPEDRDRKRQAARIAKKTAKWNISYEFEKLRLSTSYLYQGQRYDYSSGEPYEMPSYSLVDISAVYAVSDSLSVSGRVANVFNKKYEIAKDYKTQDRSYFATLSYQF